MCALLRLEIDFCTLFAICYALVAMLDIRHKDKPNMVFGISDLLNKIETIDLTTSSKPCSMWSSHRHSQRKSQIGWLWVYECSETVLSVRKVIDL